MSISAIVSVLGGVRATVFAGAAIAALAVSGALWVKCTYLKGQLSDVAAATAKKDLEDVTRRAAEYRASAERIRIIEEDYEKRLASAKSKHAAVLDDLRNARLSLLDHWSCPEGSASGPGESDERTRLREEAAARIVQIGAEADAQVQGLQALIKEYSNGRESVRSGQK